MNLLREDFQILRITNMGPNFWDVGELDHVFVMACLQWWYGENMAADLLAMHISDVKRDALRMTNVA